MGRPPAIWGRMNAAGSAVAFVPEERNGHGAVTTMTLAENAFLSGYIRNTLVRFGVIDRKRTRAFANDIIKRFDVAQRAPARRHARCPAATCKSSWWGARCCRNPSVLAINQPTWGVDAGAALAIHEAIMELAAAGAAVVIISQDLDELFVLADRIAVIAGGRLSAPIPTHQATIEFIGRLMGGPSASAYAAQQEPVHA